MRIGEIVMNSVPLKLESLHVANFFLKRWRCDSCGAQAMLMRAFGGGSKNCFVAKLAGRGSGFKGI